MADFTLQDGTEITFDLSKITYGQYLGLFDQKESDERSDKTIARVAGMDFKELKNLNLLEYKRLVKALFEKFKEPLSDPNSPSAPSSE